jgi:DNA primase
MSTTQGTSTHATRLSRTPEGLIYSGDVLAYRITGLTAYNLDRLRITLKASCERSAMSNEPEKAQSSALTAQSLFHIDTLDLYNSRCRESYAEACAKYLKAQQAAVMLELSQLIAALEAERISIRENGAAAAKVPEMSTDEKREALAALKNKDLIKNILADFDAIGFIGEKTNKLLAYIAAVSRMQPDPLAILILSRPGAGKTRLQDTVCKFVPPESVLQYTRLTGQALFYSDPNALKNKVMAIEEDEGITNSLYSVKTLISSQKLSVATTRTDPKTGKMSVDEYTVNGPVVVFVSTTKPDSLDDETKRRFMILTIDETPEQTRQILIAHRTKNSHRWYEMSCDEAGITRLHHNMQRMLKPLIVTFPDNLNIPIPELRLQVRGEHGKFYSLVKAVVLLFQYQRKSGTMKRKDNSAMEFVQATQADVDLALELGREAFIRDLDDVSPTGRALLAEILKLATEKYTAMKADQPELLLCQVPFTRKELRDDTGWSETQVRNVCEHLAELGYLGRIAGRQGSACRYVLLDDGRDDPLIEFGKKPEND